MKTFEYDRAVMYHETDRMGVTHHSNYIKWMEEARIFALDSAGASYAELEKIGVVCPVVELSVRYKAPTTFADKVKVLISVKEYNGIKLSFDYKIVNTFDGATVTEATSAHCFLRGGKIVNLARELPEVDELLRENM